MKKLLLLLPLVLSMLVALDSLGQDVRVNAITNPSSGCNLGAFEVITFEIENVGTTDLSGIPFTVTYVVNAGAPVTEPVVIASFLPNTTTTYSFLTVANLSIPGAYVIDGSCLLIGDVNPSNDAINGYLVTSDAPTVGGAVAGSATVCSSGNAGVLTLGGHTGSVNRWEYSIDGGISWIVLANTTTSQNYLNLTATTMYHAVVQNGTCLEAISVPATITVNQAPVGGTVGPDVTVCQGANAGTMTLSGESGTIVGWEFSTDNGTTWTPIANVTNSEPFLNLLVTTWYRAILNGGVCGNTTSSIGIVTVDPAPVGGTVSLSATVCSSGNAGVLTLAGHTGSVNRWEYSIDGGLSWIVLANNTTSQNYLNLTATTMYHAVVQSGTCPEAISLPATITVNQAPVGGSVTASTEVCETYNTGTLALTGESGTIVDWEFSVDSGATWTSAGNITNTLVFNNLTTTTWYQVIVDNGVCGTVNSSIGVVTVHPKPIPLYTVADVCIGATSSFVNGTSIAAGVTSFYLWDFGDGTSSVSLNPVHTYGAPGIYSASLITISDEGCADTAFVNATVNALPDPTITANGPVAFCMGGSVDLSGEPGLNYLWSTTEITQTITVNTSGLYTLNVVDPITLCTNFDTMTVTVWANPVANAGNDTTISLGWLADLHGSGGDFYQWSPAATLDDAFIATPIAYPLISTGYELTVTDLNGCVDIDSVIVTVLVDYLFTPANVVTPNGDGENDVWNIINIENYPDNQVAIYNRYGQEIFKATGYNNEWDATFEGKQVPDASYYYVLTFDGSEKIFKGAITVLGK
ncbi:MAG: gliding motility-associated C-terminal domain-containing protein [Fluviicola sp.]|nr:gliding motility-associated C-terminal domain-containing protein [Fluviicola sp.]